MFTPRNFKSVTAKMRYIADQCYELVPIQFCIYCGDEWEVYDHVPPVAAYCTNSSWAFKYPACKNCNAILGSNPIKDIRIRRWFILKRLFVKYNKIINIPNWTNPELHEIKGWVRGYIKSSCRKQKHLIKRIDFLTENYKEIKGFK
jgi:hypothetical protein